MSDAGAAGLPVPPGPGVQPPFAAAPIEGRTTRRWLGLLVGAVVLLACCGISGIAVGGLVFTAAPAMNEQAQVAVASYLDALIEEDWEQAHELRCPADQQAEPLREFAARVRAEPRVDSYELGQIDWFSADTDVLQLPAEVTYIDGRQERQTYPLAQDPGTGTLQVCQHA